MKKMFQHAVDDMAIAAWFLQESEFGQIIGTRKLLCEIYCRNSVGVNTFFLQVYDGDPCLLVRTRPETSHYLGLHTGGCTFSEVLQADRHPACKGDVFHSVKYISNEELFLQELFACLPMTEEFAERSGAVLDGSICLLRDHRFGEPVCLAFQTVDSIAKNVFSQAQKEFLYEISAHVERIFGC